MGGSRAHGISDQIHDPKEIGVIVWVCERDSHAATMGGTVRLVKGTTRLSMR